MSAFSNDFAPTVPYWEARPEGWRLLRPTDYFTAAKEFLEKNASKGIIGFIVRNEYGRKFGVSALVLNRMQSLFESGQLEIIDYMRNHNVDSVNVGMQGFDTEGADTINQFHMRG